MGVVSRRWVWVESVGVVVRRYIDFFILLIPTPVVSAFFSAASLLFVHLKKNVFRYFYLYYDLGSQIILVLCVWISKQVSAVLCCPL